MKVVVYSVRSYEKEFIAKANRKKHDITLISNALNPDTAYYAEGKDAAVVFTNDDVSAQVVHKLADLGIKYIATRSAGTDHIDHEAAKARNIKIANVPSYSPEAIAEYSVGLALALSRKLVPTADHVRSFDFRIDGHIGFNLHGKTVGIIGLGQIGKAAARIYRGFGCRVLAYDIEEQHAPGVTNVNLDTLYAESDLISSHVPLTPSTRHLINRKSLSKMKAGVMLINTSRGAVVNTQDIIAALESGRVGFFGMDVYEFEKGLFFYNHQHDIQKDPMLNKLITFPNVMVSPHQAFLTTEALQEIMAKTIWNLDIWQEEALMSVKYP